MAQLMPLPLTVSCFSKIQIGFTFLVPAHLGIPGKRAVKRLISVFCISISVILLLNSRKLKKFALCATSVVKMHNRYSVPCLLVLSKYLYGAVDVKTLKID